MGNLLHNNELTKRTKNILKIKKSLPIRNRITYIIMYAFCGPFYMNICIQRPSPVDTFNIEKSIVMIVCLAV